MKKFISFILLVFILVGFSFSDSVLDYLDSVGGEILFGYNTDNNISVDSINDDHIVIKSPVLYDEFGDVISSYTLMYSEYPLVEVLEDPSLLDYSKEKIFNNLNLEGENYFTMELSTADGINVDSIYYVVAVPKDDAGTLGEVSNELCFRLAGQIHGEGDECENNELSEFHGAGADMNLANIHHTINGNTVTLGWIALDGSDSIDIFLWDEDAGTFNKLATVNMFDESYSFNVNRDGNYILKFIPSNGGIETNYTFNVIGINGSVEPTGVEPEVTPVVVGPKENILVVLFASFLIYIVYRLAKKKA